MKVTVNINEEELTNLVTEQVAGQLIKEARRLTPVTNGIRSGVDKAVKQYIYAEKDKIIDRVVDRATKEIVRKALPKLLEAMESKETNHD